MGCPEWPRGFPLAARPPPQSGPQGSKCGPVVTMPSKVRPKRITCKDSAFLDQRLSLGSNLGHDFCFHLLLSLSRASMVGQLEVPRKYLKSPVP